MQPSLNLNPLPLFVYNPYQYDGSAYLAIELAPPFHTPLLSYHPFLRYCVIGKCLSFRLETTHLPGLPFHPRPPSSCDHRSSTSNLSMFQHIYRIGDCRPTIHGVPEIGSSVPVLDNTSRTHLAFIVVHYQRTMPPATTFPV